jgi:hypothetical protein
MADRIVKSPTDARSGSKEGVVRYILAISITLVVLFLIAGYVIS